MTDALVVIPTYNEIENIERVIRAVFSLRRPFHILVVDDGSPDGTAQKVASMQREFPEQLFILNRTKKAGLGRAYIAGFKWALEKPYGFIFEMDADFSHNPKDLLRLYNAFAKASADLVVGSRYVKGVNVVNWPMGRVLMSWLASKYVRFITSMPVHDTTAGFVGYRRKVLETINLDAIKFVGYAFQIEMKYEAYRLGFEIAEVPVIFTDRTLGVSKMSSGIISEAIFGVITMRIKHAFRKRK